MPEYYFIIVGILLILAVSDLVVGVSNDAVNFLNSAIGSKVAPFKTIMIVVSAGILIGAIFSSGMMEVARSGVFNPAAFVFADVMVIFLAVMLTDIFLLDLFNTFGLPTSTTVSLIFELLGAAIGVAILKIMHSGDGLNTLGHYINSDSAIAIVSTILTSVVVAFAAGSIVMYLSRLLFSFQYQRRMKWVGGIWSGLALTFLTHYLLFKGVKGVSFVSGEFVQWMADNTSMLLLATFLFWVATMQVLVSFFKVNVLKFIVLFGTFSLAMAFAGNDLVNFIGVPMAGLESFRLWTSSGQGAESLNMDLLNQPVRTESYLLVIAGLVMIATLWLSSKARTVTETEVSLGRQEEGTEGFSSNLLARNIVRYTRLFGNGLQAIVPAAWIEKAEKNFENNGETLDSQPDTPAFDLVRASVNLTIASMLIAFATSLKLPLSTTYVTFMVAMGASLADRAWGRDSAVYRVAGVLNVIGGWFVTAIIAFTVSGVIAMLLHSFEIYALIPLVGLLTFFIYRTFVFHRMKEKSKAAFRSFENETAPIPAHHLIEDTSKNVAIMLRNVATTYRNAITGLVNEDRSLILVSVTGLLTLQEQVDNLRKMTYRSIKRLEGQNTEAGRLFLFVYDLEQDLAQSIGFIVESCRTHIENSHKPVLPEQAGNLRYMLEEVETYLTSVADRVGEGNFFEVEDLKEQKRNLVTLLEEQLSQQISGIQKNGYGRRNSMLMFSLKLETKDIVAAAHRFVKLYNRIGLPPKKESVSMIEELV